MIAHTHAHKKSGPKICFPIQAKWPQRKQNVSPNDDTTIASSQCGKLPKNAGFVVQVCQRIFTSTRRWFRSRRSEENSPKTWEKPTKCGDEYLHARDPSQGKWPSSARGREGSETSWFSTQWNDGRRDVKLPSIPEWMNGFAKWHQGWRRGLRLLLNFDMPVVVIVNHLVEKFQRDVFQLMPRIASTSSCLCTFDFEAPKSGGPGFRYSFWHFNRSVELAWCLFFSLSLSPSFKL